MLGANLGLLLYGEVSVMILSQGGRNSASQAQKWFITLKRSFTVYEKEDFTLSLKHQLYE